MASDVPETSPNPSFPVVFFDGEREIDIGNVTVDPSLGFKRLQSILSRKIGISPQQISIFLICRKKSKISPENRRKIPINENSNFAVIVREKDCFFSVILKRSREKRKPHRILEDQPEKMLLRRDPQAESPFYGLTTVPESVIAGRGLNLGFLDYERQLLNLQMQREKYLMSTMRDGYVSYPVGDRMPTRFVVCEECAFPREMPVPFHWCVYDTVTVGFRSPAGPIQRPSKPRN